MPKYCDDCGNENRDTAKFCRKCGGKLEPSGNALISTPILLDNRYEIISIVKSGAMGCIYKARDTRLDNIVAVKQMLSSFANPNDAQYLETRFKEEARMLSTLHHGGLPKVMDYFTVREPSTGKLSHYLVMTFIEGPDLETIIHQRGGKLFPVDEAVGYLAQILDILHYLHGRNPPVIYRDLNPRNTMIQEGRIFLVDFGIARLFTPAQKGTSIGTPGYAAPEQYKGDAEPRSDIFSLGVMMHYLLTGKNPEDASKSNFTFDAPKTLNPWVTEWLDSLIMSMVDVLPDKRPKCAAEIMHSIVSSSQVDTSGSIPLPAATKSPVAALTSAVALASSPFLTVESNEDAKYSDVFQAIYMKDLQALKDFIRKKPSLISARNNKGETPLHDVAHNVSLFSVTDNKGIYRDMLMFLISMGADVNAEDDDGGTPLHSCSSCGRHTEGLELLISNGANVNAKRDGGLTPLHDARKKDIAQVLISGGADVNAKDNKGDTPLHSPMDKEMLELLIFKGAIVDTRNDAGVTPLHKASFPMYTRERMDVLISNGADVNIKDNNGQTPLHWACMLGNKATAKLLISNGADINDKNGNGDMPLHVAGKKGYFEIVEVLLSKGADINAKNSKDSTVLKMAKQGWLEKKQSDETKKEYEARSSRCYETVKMLGKYGAQE